MFILTPTDTFKSTVKVNVKTESGTWREESFTAIFQRTLDEDREELIQLKNVELLRRVLKGWEMVDQNRNPVPFTPENLESFLRLTGAVREAATQYWLDNTGAKQKN